LSDLTGQPTLFPAFVLPSIKMNPFNNETTLNRNLSRALQLESLEDRLMLSTVEVFAAGATGEEKLDIFINGVYETTFFEVGAILIHETLFVWFSKPIKT